MLMPSEKNELVPKSSELYIDSNDSGRFCGSFVCEPANVDEIQIGSLYIAGEVKSSSRKCAYLINSLASIIKKELYRNIRRSALESFEAGLAKANAHLTDIASQGNVEWIGRVNVACALISENCLHVSQTGNARILLLRDLLITSVIEENIKEDFPPFPSKTFSNISSGPLNHKDKLIITTSGLFNMLSLEEIKHMLSEISAKQAVESLGELFEMDKDAPTTAMIIVDAVCKAVENFSYSAKSAEVPSINSDFNIQRLSLKDIIGDTPIASLQSNARNEEIRGLQEIQPLSKTRKILKRLLQQMVLILQKLFKLSIKFSQKFIKLSLAEIQKAAIKLARFIKICFYIITKNKNKIQSAGLKDGADEAKKQIVIKIKKNSENSKSGKETSLIYLKNLLNIKNAIILTIGIAAATLGILAGAFYFKKKSYEPKENISAAINPVKFNEYLKEIGRKKEDAETALIYKDENKARKILIEAAGLAEESIQFGIRTEEISQLRKDIQIQLDQIDKIFTIENPFVVSDIGKSEIPFEPSIIAGGNNKLIIIDFLGKQAAEISLAEYKLKNLKKINASEQEKILGASFLENGSLSLITSFSNEISLDLENGTEERKIISNLELLDVGNIESYGDNIYILDGGKKQIFKISSGQSRVWLKNGIPLDANLVYMAIDGNVFALSENGDVLKFSQGKLKETFSFGAKNILKRPSAIYTNPALDKLFILDPPSSKIVVANKKGAALSQYKSEKFDNLKSIFADAASNSIYLLNGKIVYRIDM